MGPPPRSFAADAYDCIMVRSSRIDRIQGCGADLRAPIVSSPRMPSFRSSGCETPSLNIDERKFYPSSIGRADEIRASRRRLWLLGLRIRGQAPRLRRAARGSGALTARRNRAKEPPMKERARVWVGRLPRAMEI